MSKNRSIIIIAISLAVLLGTQCGLSYSSPPPRVPQPTRYRFVLPGNDVGWVRIDFGVSSAPQWPFDLDTTTVAIPETEMEQTASPFVLRKGTEVLLYYQRGGDLVRVPHELYENPLVTNGLLASAKWAPDMVKEVTWYFFVGPASLRGPYRANDVMLPGADVPSPGRLTAPQTEPRRSTGPNP